MTDKKKEQLDINATDIIAEYSKSIANWIPIVRPIIAPKIGFAIPRQRVDRIADFVRMLDERLENVEELLQTPESLDLLEDALTQAAKAINAGRRVYIANMLKNGLTNQNNSHLEKKKLFSILESLNEIEILKLKYLSYDHLLEVEKNREQPLADLSLKEIAERKESFFNKHRDFLSSVYFASNEPLTKFNDSFMLNLEQNGLISIGEEETVLGKTHIYSITPFGLLFLDYIEVPES